MSTLMEKALEEIGKLPEPEQDALAEWLLNELASERKWAQALADSEELLAQLADEALAEHRASETFPLDLENM